MTEGPASSEIVGQASHSSVEDIHICGSCKLQFNNVRSFLIHKKSGCSTLQVAVTSNADVAIPLLLTCDDGNHSQQQNVEIPVANDLQTCMGQCAESSNNVLSSNNASPNLQILCNVDLPNTSAGKNETQTPKSVVKPTSGSRRYPEKRFRCEVEGCQYNSQYMKDLLRHIRTHTGEKPFTCSSCSKSFNRADKLKLHERWHKGDKPYKCKQCDYATGDCSSLKKHLRVHSDERPFKCQICQYASRNSSQLVVHLRTHTGDSPFQCPYCSTKFKINSDLKRHLRMHTGEKPYACQMCNYRCAIKGNLKTHIRLNHIADTLYQCVHCPFATPSRKLLREHDKSHDAKAMRCPQCNYFCTTRTALKNHLRVHSDDRPFKCDHCSYASRQPGNVRTHMKKRHPEKLGRNKKATKRTPSSATTTPATAGDGSVSVSCEGRNAPRQLAPQPTPLRASRPQCIKTFQCTWCEEAFVREDSLRSHLRQHQDRLKMGGSSGAIAVLQLASPLVGTLTGSDVGLLDGATLTATGGSGIEGTTVMMSSAPNLATTVTSPIVDANNCLSSPLPNTVVSSEPRMVGVIVSSEDMGSGVSSNILSSTPIIVSHNQVIEQALQQSGVLNSQQGLAEGCVLTTTNNTPISTVATTTPIPTATQQFIAYIQNPRQVAQREDSFPNAAILAALNLKSNAVALDQAQGTNGNPDPNADASSSSTFCNYQGPVMYQFQPGVGLVPILPAAGQLLQTSTAGQSAPLPLGTLLQDQDSANIQYVLQTGTSPDVPTSIMLTRTTTADPIQQTHRLLAPKDSLSQPTVPQSQEYTIPVSGQMMNLRLVDTSENHLIVGETGLTDTDDHSASQLLASFSSAYQNTALLTSQPIYVTSQLPSHIPPDSLFANAQDRTVSIAAGPDEAAITASQLSMDAALSKTTDVLPTNVFVTSDAINPQVLAPGVCGQKDAGMSSSSQLQATDAARTMP